MHNDLSLAQLNLSVDHSKQAESIATDSSTVTTTSITKTIVLSIHFILETKAPFSTTTNHE